MRLRKDFLRKNLIFPFFLYNASTTRIWRGSSVVEQRPEKPCVGSSILLLATTKIKKISISKEMEIFLIFHITTLVNNIMWLDSYLEDFIKIF